MIRLLFSVSFVMVLAGCGSKPGKDPKPPQENLRIKELERTYELMLSEAETIRHQDNGWITPDDCDGFLWTGKYASAHGVEGVDLTAAEYGDSGRFGRRPPPWCWEEGRGDNGSRTTWSRDMALGLLAYAFEKGDRALLERHVAYGDAHDWVMGEPIADGRAIYTPGLIGEVFIVLRKIGGRDDPRRRLPNVYAAGLRDYQAHLQIMSIWLRAGIIGRDYESISDTMFSRIKEHAEREPNNPFYRYMLGVFTGDMAPTVDLLLREDEPVGEYVRCNEFRRCQLAERIFVASQTLEWLHQKEL